VTIGEHVGLVENTKSLADVQVQDYDGVFLVGGQAPMYTFYHDERVHDFGIGLG